MSGLIIKLKPHEEVMVNGVLMQNGDRGCRLRVVSPDANILRLSEAIQSDEATTPIKRAYYTAQLAVAGEMDEETARQKLTKALAELCTAFSGRDESLTLLRAAAELNAGRFYGVMRRLASIFYADEGDEFIGEYSVIR